MRNVLNYEISYKENIRRLKVMTHKFIFDSDEKTIRILEKLSLKKKVKNIKTDFITKHSNKFIAAVKFLNDFLNCLFYSDEYKKHV